MMDGERASGQFGIRAMAKGDTNDLIAPPMTLATYYRRQRFSCLAASAAGSGGAIRLRSETAIVNSIRRLRAAPALDFVNRQLWPGIDTPAPLARAASRSSRNVSRTKSPSLRVGCSGDAGRSGAASRPAAVLGVSSPWAIPLAKDRMSAVLLPVICPDPPRRP